MIPQARGEMYNNVWYSIMIECYGEMFDTEGLAKHTGWQSLVFSAM